MFRYLKEAFFIRARVPLLGGVPVNVLLSIAFAILGFAHPGFWLLGAGVVGGIVLMLSSSPRFRKVVQARALAGKDRETRDLEATLVSQLPMDSRGKLADMDSRCAQVIAAYLRAEADEFTIESARDALKKLRWLYLKLLVAHNALSSNSVDLQAQQIRSELTEVDRDIKSETLSPAARASREATRDILLKRMGNVERRRHSIQEVESDLERIEAQIDLALDDATLKGQPTTISTNIDFASHLLESGGGIFGASERLVMDLEQRLGTPAAAPPAPVPAAPAPTAPPVPPSPLAIEPRPAPAPPPRPAPPTPAPPTAAPTPKPPPIKKPASPPAATPPPLPQPSDLVVDLRPPGTPRPTSRESPSPLPPHGQTESDRA